MSLSLAILASGSSGNCSILRTPAGAILIDCGIGPRVTASRLKSVGAHLDEISAICLTHADRDHFNRNWARELQRREITVYCHRVHGDGLGAVASRLRHFDSRRFSPLPELCIEPIHLPHDERGSFVIEYAGAKIGYATDLGQVDEQFILRFSDLHLLAIESNYDPVMQKNSSRPYFLKQRIMGGSGHLSNQQALVAVQRILDRCQEMRSSLPRHIVLLHRSRECNCPHKLSKLFRKDARIASRLILAEQDRPTPWMWTHDAPAEGLFDFCDHRAVLAS
jgi:phosphoribosyl 1,2-cyclic phosphodiesterase